MTKEAILRSKHNTWLYVDENSIDGEIGSVYEAMDIYAKEVAIEFTEWCAENSIGYEEGVFYYKEKDTNYRYNYSSEEMYSIFLQSKNQKQ